MDKLYAFEVKRAVVDDIPAIIKITKDAFLKYCEMAGLNYDIEALNETYDDVKRDIEEKEVYVVFIDDEPVGAVRVELLGNHEAYLSRFAVKSSERNNGIGKILMSVVDKAMRDAGVKYLRLHTGSHVTPLIRFYYGRGFYISSVENSRGYPRAELVKDYTVINRSLTLD
ncbi:MAG TPA: GNAT family N-acetyltransferase [Candidatus Monoglobus merdigallinarum]|uniref:GNAT family N-acetyltransferase n=1 Tax=Candidatus Monoglobus merdigallinarum TaxID=2838698 RepID=A0A9D1TLK3_9FIRM|nr:GNAT family N-acetyltransferase [Candidatus Monoglobus merdigallinarum]